MSDSNQILSQSFLLQVIRCRTFGIETWLLAEEPRIRGFIPGMNKRFFFSPTESILALGPYQMTTRCAPLTLSFGLTLILLTWTIWRAPANASKWRMGFNSAFKGLKWSEQESEHSPLSQPKSRMCGAHFCTFPHGEERN